MSDKKTDGDGLASLGLQNRLLEVAVIVGMDNDTGLQIRKIRQVCNCDMFLPFVLLQRSLILLLIITCIIVRNSTQH